MTADRDIEFRHRFVAITGAPFGVAAAAAAYFCSPTLRFFDPFILYMIGGFLGMAVIGFWFGAVIYDGKAGIRTMYVSGSVGIASILCLGVYVGLVAQPMSARLDIQCRLLEVDMMQLRPARSDSHDLFQDLGCRTQGIGTLKLPSSSYYQEGDYIKRRATFFSQQASHGDVVAPDRLPRNESHTTRLEPQ